ncbi:MAG TPA: ABC transporter ATP-binding protein [Stellaceae bacterium]|jgi:ABC-2 type transport system ATP-binding protein/lipopolysaccharide transport system ATP-binding protein|nr:ABC transporter ATP-binding protein [Stellaceae bacterium]
MAFVRLRDVSIEFPIYSGSTRSLKKMLLSASTRGNIGRDEHRRVSVQALTGINLDVDHGDRLALIGVNGAGKSTLLKVLAGIYEPTRGRVHAEGRVSALLTASLGLNTDATGRENIVTRGMYLDIHPRVMRRHIDEIADFTDLGYYIDMPVRTYSAGMVIRLCFAVATAFPPEILLMDEWLLAGDAAFLAKARKRMEDFVAGSSILVLASHALPLLEEWCNRAIVLDQGRIVASGTVAEMAARHQAATG